MRMQKQKFFQAKIMMLLMFVITSLTGISSAFAQAAIHGVLKVVKGDVSIIGKDGKVTKAKLGGKVFPLDKIKTGPDSRAKVVMIDNNELNISPDSMVEIKSYEFKPDEGKKNVALEVMYGKLRAKVNQKYDGEENKFQVKTKSAVAGVRGTDFITGYDKKQNSTRIVTFEGRVQFGLPGANGKIENAVFVGVGQTTEVVGKAPPAQPVEVPKSELAHFDNSSDAEKAPATAGDASSSSREPSSVEDKKDESKKDESKKDESKKDEAKSNDKGQKPGESRADKDKGLGNDKKQGETASNGSGSGAKDAAAPGAAPGTAGAASATPGAKSPDRGMASIGAPSMPPAPGSMPGGAMLLPQDLPSGNVVFAPPPSLVVMPPPTFLQPVYRQPVCTLCNQIIEGKNATLSITVTPSGP